jgi:hypothetical protein
MRLFLNTLTWVIFMSTVSVPSAQGQAMIAHELFDSYPTYRLDEISSRRFTQADMMRWLGPLRGPGGCEVAPIGESAEGRSISLLKLGRGKTKVLIWSQMHGDESTATMAILDMLSFFAKAAQHPVAAAITERLTLLMIPMLNPDGAERFERRTAQVVDMNRDALALRTPEARALRGVCDNYRPEFGFNLHDQDPRNTVGSTKQVSAIALLAPAFDEPRSSNRVRSEAVKVVATFAAVMQEFIPKNIAKYDDTFEPRAFGDNMQKWGTSTVLVESGGWPGDQEKVFLRKLNYAGLLTTLYALATGEYQRADVRVYEGLPFNTEYIYDLIVRNATLKPNDRTPAITVDIGINIDEETDPKTGVVRPVGKVVDIGDLSTFISFEEIDMGHAQVSDLIRQIDQQVSMEEIDMLKLRKQK